MLRPTAPKIMILLSICIAISAVFGSHGLLHLSELNNELQVAEAKNRELESEIAALRQELFEFNASEVAVERRAREELGLSYPNEIVYIFPEKRTEEPTFIRRSAK